MIELVYGTGNPAKLAAMRETLAPIGIEIIGLNETGIAVPDVEESGSTPLENARIKALAYYNALKRPVFSCDSGLYIDGLSDEEQPGIHIRMVNGKRLSDEEMITHYSDIARRMGGRAVARYKNAICLVMGSGEVYEHFGDDIASYVFYLVDKPHNDRVRVSGFPLDCLSVHIGSGEYYYDREQPKGEISLANRGFQAFFRKVLISP